MVDHSLKGPILPFALLLRFSWRHPDTSRLCQPSDSVDGFSASSLSCRHLYLTTCPHAPWQKGYDWYSYLIRASLSKQSLRPGHFQRTSLCHILSLLKSTAAKSHDSKPIRFCHRMIVTVELVSMVNCGLVMFIEF